MINLTPNIYSNRYQTYFGLNAPYVEGPYDDAPYSEAIKNEMNSIYSDRNTAWKKSPVAGGWDDVLSGHLGAYRDGDGVCAYGPLSFSIQGP